MLFSDAVSNIFAGVFDALYDVRQNVAVVLLFLYSIIPNLDAIIRVRVLLCEISILLFVTVCCYAKPQCYSSCPYAVMRNLNSSLWKKVIAWERSRTASGCGIIWGDADRNKQGGI